MRLVRRVFAGAAASLALGALFTGVALGAEPTIAEAEATAIISVGPGTGGALETDAVLEADAILDVALTGGAGGAATTDVVVDADAALGIGPAAAPTNTATVEATIGAATATVTTSDVAADATAEVDAEARIRIDATQASLAGAGMHAGSLMIIDLDAGREDAVTSSDVAANLTLAVEEDTAATDTTVDACVSLGAGNCAGAATGDVAADLTLGVGTDAAATDATIDACVSLGAGNCAGAATGDVAADLTLGVGTDAAATDAAVAACLSLGAGNCAGAAAGDVAADLTLGIGTDVAAANAAVLGSLSLGAGADAPAVGGTAADAGLVGRLGTGGVLGIRFPAPVVDAGVAAGGGTVDGDEPTGGDGAAAPAEGSGPGALSLPDTALGAANEIAIWGLLLAILAGLMASVRRLPMGRP